MLITQITPLTSAAGASPVSPGSLGYRIGTGNWKAAVEGGLELDRIREAAEKWKQALAGVDKPWLCWSVDSDWCLLQQRLVEHVGWTPVVGFDPRAGRPALSGKALLIDFNEVFQLPTMWFHFPVEFAFLFCNRLAFWHSDLLCRREKLLKLAALFDGLRDGEIAAVKPKMGIRERLRHKQHRFFELVGCTTQAASKDQFEKGCGWWINFAQHPNCPNGEERERRMQYHWECGVGILYWARNYSGKVKAIPEGFISEGHFTRINNPSYVKLSPDDFRRDLTRELSHNFHLMNSAHKVNIVDMLD